MPDISIIVPVYNAEKYIERCLDSILTQTYEDYEVVLVDDGSTDGSGDICLSYCDTDERFRFLSQENSGPDIARKSGLKASTGDYIMFVDADDYVASDILEKSIKAIRENQADLVCTQRIRFDDDGRQWDESLHADKPVIYDDVSDRMAGYFKEDLLLGTYYAKLIDRRLIEDYPFVEDSVIGEDVTAALYMLRHARRVVVLPNLGYYYYWNLNSVSHSGYSLRHRRSLENYIRVRDDILSGHFLEDKYVCGYFAEFEMAVATAMSRGWTYDKKTARMLKEDISKHWAYIKANKKTPLYMKACMEIYRCCPMLFIIMYRVVYLITGR